MRTKVEVLVLVIVIISGCSGARPTDTSSQIPEISPTMQVTIPQESTQTSAIPVETATIQPTRTNSPTTTITPLATLHTKQTGEIIKAFLQNVGYCSVPCFVGIMPDKTPPAEAKNILVHLGLPIQTITNDGYEFFDSHYDFENGLSVSGNLAVKDEMIKNIRIGIEPEPIMPGNPRSWKGYSPESLISFYGQPSHVSFATDWGPRSFFAMNLYFDKVDLIVEYVGYDIISKQKGPPVICPLSMPFEYVKIWIGKEPINPPLPAVLLEQATSLTIEEFSQLMTGNTDQACFTLRDAAIP